jgi:hypothetical protein
MNVFDSQTYKDGGKHTTYITVPLGAVDPATIKSEFILEARVSFATTNGKHLIWERVGSNSGFVESTWINLTDKNYAPRFLAALKHLVDLCGGQESPF